MMLQEAILKETLGLAVKNFESGIAINSKAKCKLIAQEIVATVKRLYPHSATQNKILIVAHRVFEEIHLAKNNRFSFDIEHLWEREMLLALNKKIFELYGPVINPSDKMTRKAQEVLYKELTKQLSAEALNDLKNKTHTIQTKINGLDDSSDEEDDDYLPYLVLCSQNKRAFTRELFGDILKEVRQLLSSQDKDAARPLHIPGYYYLYQDSAFLTYDANRLEHTHFIACAGPFPPMQKLGNLDFTVTQFLQSLLYFKQEGTPAIKKIIGLGEPLKDKVRTTQDFYNYNYDDRPKGARSVLTPKSHVIKDVHGVDTLKLDLAMTLDRQSSNLQEVAYSMGQLTVTPCNNAGQTQQVETVLIELHDGQALDLSIESEHTEVLKRLLWDCAQESRKHSIAVHCKAGIGRTGHLIFTLEMVKHFDRIFSSNKPEVITGEIMKTLENLRQNRIALVDTLCQFVFAIKNALSIYDYALKHHLVESKGKSHDLGLFARPKTPIMPAASAAAANSLTP